MTPADMVYMEVYKGCLKQGNCESVSKDTDILTLQNFKNNQFSKVSKLIAQAITDAKKLIVKKSKNAKR